MPFVRPGDGVRSFRLGRAGLGECCARAGPFAWTASITLYVAFHDAVIGAIVARQVEMRAAYEDRLAEARARLDEAASRQMLERSSFQGKLNEVTLRQARLEQRSVVVAALAQTEARNQRAAARSRDTTPSPADAISAIQALVRRPRPARAGTTLCALTPPFPSPLWDQDCETSSDR